MRSPLAALYLVWTLWAISWGIAALWADRTVSRPAARREWGYRIFTFPGWMLLLAFPGFPGQPVGLWPFAPLWRLPVAIDWALVGLAVAGVGVAWWARLHLGRLWSAALTRKTGHRIVDSGPYAIVRHPIYTGLYMAALATLGIKANPLAIAGFALFVIGYWRKAREEETFLAAELGREAYENYKRRVPMLLPLAPF